MTRFEDVVLNQFGGPAGGATVSIFLQGTANLATLYTNDAEAPRDNPTTADSLGRFWFYIADGKYDLQVSGTSFTTYKQLDVEISDVSEAFSGDVAWKVRNLNNIRFADQFPGADAGAKITAAIADLPSTGGTVDARGLEGAQISNQDVFSGMLWSKRGQLLLGAIDLALGTIGWNVPSNWEIVGESIAATQITYTGAGAALTLDGSIRAGLRNFTLNVDSAAITARGIVLGNTTTSNLYNKLKDLYIVQSNATGQVAGQIGIYLHATGAFPLYWNELSNIVTGRWDRGIVLEGTNVGILASQNYLLGITSTANRTGLQFAGFTADNYTFGIFGSASGFAEAQTLLVFGDGANPADDNYVLGAVSDQGAAGQLFLVNAGTTGNHIEGINESGTTSVDNGTRTNFWTNYEYNLYPVGANATINALKVNSRRFKASLGTALVAGDFALSSGWGSTAAVSAVTGTDQGWNITVTCGGTGIGANPTITLTFKDLTWTNAPIVISKMVGGTGTITDLTEPPVDQTDLVWKITFNGTPVDTKTYIISGIVMGR